MKRPRRHRGSDFICPGEELQFGWSWNVEGEKLTKNHEADKMTHSSAKVKRMKELLFTVALVLVQVSLSSPLNHSCVSKKDRIPPREWSLRVDSKHLKTTTDERTNDSVTVRCRPDEATFQFALKQQRQHQQVSYAKKWPSRVANVAKINVWHHLPPAPLETHGHWQLARWPQSILWLKRCSGSETNWTGSFLWTLVWHHVSSMHFLSVPCCRRSAGRNCFHLWNSQNGSMH